MKSQNRELFTGRCQRLWQDIQTAYLHSWLSYNSQRSKHMSSYLALPWRKSTKQAAGSTAAISIQLADEAGEITVLEVPGQEQRREFVRIPNNEAVPSLTPRHNRICSRVFHHFEGLGEKWRGTHLVKPLHGMSREARRWWWWRSRNRRCTRVTGNRLLLLHHHCVHQKNRAISRTQKRWELFSEKLLILGRGFGEFSLMERWILSGSVGCDGGNKRRWRRRF